MIKYTMQQIIDWVPSFSLLEILIRTEYFSLLHLGLEGVTEVDTNPKERFVSFQVTTSNESSVCAPSGYSTRERLARGHIFEGLQRYMQNKN